MGLKDRLRKLERAYQDELITIPQTDGSIKRFSKSDLKAGFLNGIDRVKAEREEDRPPEHPLLTAAKNSSDPRWSRTFYSDFELAGDEPLEDLSEPNSRE